MVNRPLRKYERMGKRALMRVFGAFLSAEPMDGDGIRARRPRRILVIRQHNQMGDMLLAVPALRAIKQGFDGAELSIISSTLNAGVLANNPYVDYVFTYDKRDPLSHVGLIRRLRRRRLDLAIVLHTVSFSFTSLLLAVLSGARDRVGSTSAKIGDSLTGSYFNLTLPLPTTDELATMNEAEHNLYPLRALGIDATDLAPVVVPAAENETWAREFGDAHWTGDCVRLVVHPGAGKVENIWPPERFAEVVNGLATGDARVIAVEGPRDGDAVTRFVSGCEAPVAIARARPIGDIAALMRSADLVLCNDTGVMHVASAAGARTLAVFGPTDPERWAPRVDNLHKVRAPGGRLADLDAATVRDAAMSLLAETPR